MKLLANPLEQRDNCGVGFIVNLKGQKSHQILQQAIESVSNLSHRGAISADGKTGDGAGVLTQIPTKLFIKELRNNGVEIANEAPLAVGMAFLPRSWEEATERCKKIIDEVLHEHSLISYGWRDVPINKSALGERAYKTLPSIQQILVGVPDDFQFTDENAFERQLYLARKIIQSRVIAQGINKFHFASFSSRTIVYKGLFVAAQLPNFYLDLSNPDYETSFALFHQRYSTNTFPTWPLAQPFRMIAHNGEINTIRANRNWMTAREGDLKSTLWGDNIENLTPVIEEFGSDSYSLDNAIELLTLSGRDIRHACMMLIPEAWEEMPDLDPQLRAFYQYHSCVTEPWDGPAALAYTDGRFIAASLDRNGFRPARYVITNDGLLILASEVGTIQINPTTVSHRGRLGPGEMLAVDIEKGTVFNNAQLKSLFSSRRDYKKWVETQIIELDEHSHCAKETSASPAIAPEQLLTQQTYFGFSAEEMKLVIHPMIEQTKEPVWSMGDDTPITVLSNETRLIYSYFKQKFAQVTNPPIDPIRERLVMSLTVTIGRRKSYLEETSHHANLIRLKDPVLEDYQLSALKTLKGNFNSAVISTLFDPKDGPASLELALNRICYDACDAIDNNAELLILSDKGIDKSRASVPMLLAVGAVNQHLTRQRKRMKVSLIVETGEAFEVHHFACLIGFGATAVCPYLAFQTVDSLAKSNSLSATMAQDTYRASLIKGLLKVMSKMGISSIASYHGAQTFEAIGLAESVVERCFQNTSARLEGMTFEDIGQEVLKRHNAAFRTALRVLPNPGFYSYRRSGERHSFNPKMVKTLQKSVKTGDYDDYKSFTKQVNNRKAIAIRDLLSFQSDRSSIPLDEVESIDQILKRFTSQAMSIGALSIETHKALSIAMNRIGARSNTGEGGEDPSWWTPMKNGDSAESKIKQIASGRFGVTPEYLVRAEQIEIKMAQGAKPGEGGQLPAHKVTEEIARLRRSMPGLSLISPAPHHDIYSIEDLAQLIFDLKSVNKSASICVKLVSEEGIGTVAAGVTKAYADVILISGHEGGTGASPISSIKNAGLPWELGLAEAQQILVLNNLRGRIKLRVDGGLKTGRDVLVAACLGAEEYGFGTMALVAVGCVMTRQCHLNTCPVGIATQRPELRKRFKGTPEAIVHYFTHVAQDVRQRLAKLGYKSLDELIGRSDLLTPLVPQDAKRSSELDLSSVVAVADPSGKLPTKCKQPNNNDNQARLDDAIIEKVLPDLALKKSVEAHYPIRNTNRATGARLCGELARLFGDKGLPPGSARINFLGSAGQSFGAFNLPGVRLQLEGEANDYVGKSMAGGEIIIKPFRGQRLADGSNVLLGNTCLYGATGGSLFASGAAGERFAVRNSGANAVIEGVGAHACEYMTGGCVVVLGKVGRNFGAGMTSGQCFIFDPNHEFNGKANHQSVSILPLCSDDARLQLKALLKLHVQYTGSMQAKNILEQWDTLQSSFLKILPKVALETRILTDDSKLKAVS